MHSEKHFALSDEEIMSVFHAGEIAALDEQLSTDSSFLETPDLMRVWMLGYLGLSRSDIFVAKASRTSVTFELGGLTHRFDMS